MKKTVLLLALAAASLEVAAQSTMTIFGNVDLNITRARAGDTTATLMDQGGNRVPSRIGFRGTEDLGGGLTAGFWLESALLPDTGAVSGAMFSRRSTLSLSSLSLGEIRLGRDYVATFWNISSFTPFGTVGVAGASNIILGWPTGLANATTALRANNSIAYHLPRTSSGVYGQATYALSEGVDGSRYAGARLGYAQGPVDVAIAYGYSPARDAKYKTATLGGTYDFGTVKLFANYHRQERAGDSQANLTLGLSATYGLSQILASIANSDRKGPAVSADDARQWALGYVYMLSKRTDLYATYSAISNKGNAAFTTTSLAGAAGRPSTGVQLGMTHRF